MGESHCSGERERYGRHNWDVQGVPAGAEACISCYSLRRVMHSARGIGPRSWIPWQYQAHRLPGRCSQFGGSYDGHHAYLWGWRLQPCLAPPLTLVKVLSCCLRVHRVRGSPRQWSLSLAVSGSFRDSSAVLYWPPQTVFMAINPSPLSGVSEPQHSVAPNPSGHADKHFRLGSAGRHWSVCRSLSNSPSTHLLLHSPLRFWSAHPYPHPWDVYQCAKLFFLQSSLPEAQVPSWLLCLPFSLFFPLCLLPYPIMWRLAWSFGSLRSSASIQ